MACALKRVEAMGELTPGPVEDRAWLLLAGRTAVMIATDDDADGEEARAMVRSMRGLLTDWRHAARQPHHRCEGAADRARR